MLNTEDDTTFKDDSVQTEDFNGSSHCGTFLIMQCTKSKRPSACKRRKWTLKKKCTLSAIKMLVSDTQ